MLVKANLDFVVAKYQSKMSYERRQSVDPALLGNRRNSRLRFTSDSVSSDNRTYDNLSLIKYHYTEILKLIGKL